MALNARKIPNTGNGSNMVAQPLDPGSYPARVAQIISLGLQKQRPYKGEEKQPRHELYITYELLDEFMEDKEGNILEDKPRWISETIPLHSLDADLAKSTKRYLALDPKMVHDGDWAQIAETPCNVVLTQKKSQQGDRVYNNVADVSSMRPKEADKAPDLKNPPKVFDIDEPDAVIFWSLPTWLQDKMKENLDYGGSALEKLVEAGKVDSSKEDKEEPKARTKKPVEEPEEDEEESEGEW